MSLIGAFLSKTPFSKSKQKKKEGKSGVWLFHKKKILSPREGPVTESQFLIGRLGLCAAVPAWLYRLLYITADRFLSVVPFLKTKCLWVVFLLLFLKEPSLCWIPLVTIRSFTSFTFKGIFELLSINSIFVCCLKVTVGETFPNLMLGINPGAL